MRPDFVKLDESLVRRLNDHPVKQRLLASIAGAVADVEGAVIATCVESEGEADTLSRSGAEYARGYWYYAGCCVP